MFFTSNKIYAILKQIDRKNISIQELLKRILRYIENIKKED